LCFRLRTRDQLIEQGALELQSLVEREIHGRFDASYYGLRCLEASKSPGVGTSKLREEGRSGSRRLGLIGQIPQT
jgi:hypothetical protein